MRGAALVLLCAFCAVAAAGGKGKSGAKGGPVMGIAPGSTPSGAGGGHGGTGVAIGAAALVEPARPIDARPPPMDPQRVVEEVDCTKPVDFTTGNLKCK